MLEVLFIAGEREERLTWDEESTPANNDKVILPTNLGEADWSSLEKDNGRFEEIMVRTLFTCV